MPGTGTGFLITLPQTSERPAKLAPTPESVAPGRGEMVLVIDDDDAVRRSICRILNRAGYELIEARNAYEALNQAEEHQGSVQLALTDLGLPGMAGDELADQLREKYPSLRIAYMTGYATRQMLPQNNAMGTGALLPKPFSDTRLLELVRSVLDAPTTVSGPPPPLVWERSAG